MQLNNQPRESKVLSVASGDLLDIQLEPWLTLQGEGPTAGTPAVFIRLAGCNLQCPWCDTDYTSSRKMISINRLMDMVAKVAGDHRLIVLTGGEPFRQPIGPFINLAISRDFHVQIETNGTMFQPMDFGLSLRHQLSVICSPKTARINNRLAPFITAYKYVVRVGEIDPEDGLPTKPLGGDLGVSRPHSRLVQVFVNPMDEQDPVKNAANLKAAADVCMKHGYRLGIQMHKLVGIT